MRRTHRALAVLAQVLFGLAVACTAPAPPAAIDQSSPEATVRSFYSALATRRYGDALQLLRAKDGRELTPEVQQRLRESWQVAFRDGTIHPADIGFTSTRPLGDRERAVASNVEAVRVVFTVEGTSDSPCFRLPLRNATAPEARIDSRWYLVEEVDFPGAWVLRC